MIKRHSGLHKKKSPHICYHLCVHIWIVYCPEQWTVNSEHTPNTNICDNATHTLYRTLAVAYLQRPFLQFGVWCVDFCELATVVYRTLSCVLLLLIKFMRIDFSSINFIVINVPTTLPRAMNETTAFSLSAARACARTPMNQPRLLIVKRRFKIEATEWHKNKQKNVHAHTLAQNNQNEIETGWRVCVSNPVWQKWNWSILLKWQKVSAGIYRCRRVAGGLK